MKTGKAFFAGIVGGAAATLVMAAARAMGAAPDLAMMTGTWFGNAPTHAAWLLGFLTITIGSGLWGIFYAALFEHVLHQGGAAAGVKVGLVHMVLRGLMIGIIAGLHPLVPEVIRAPGFFMVGYGALGVLAFVASHVVFGAVMGGLYGKTLGEEAMTPTKG